MSQTIYLIIEFFDELVFGVAEAAWPLVRTDLGLNYVQIGLALSLPGFLANFVEPILSVLGDVWKRRLLILGGGVLYGSALVALAGSLSFPLLLLSLIALNPASGAFVGLSQAALMDVDASRREQNMARWNFAGSLGVVIGPLLLGAAAYIGFGWRGMYAALGLLVFAMCAAAWRRLPPDAAHHHQVPRWADLLGGLRGALKALRNRETLRWLTLLEFADLMADVFFGFIALYMVDVVGLEPSLAVLAVAVWTGVGLLGDFLLIPLLERTQGLNVLRITVIIEGLLFPCFLLVPSVTGKLVLLGLLGIFNTGWYPVLQARLYDSMPAGMSSTTMALGNVAGLFGKMLPFVIGLAAHTYGLGAAMWLLLAGPIVVFLGLPRAKPAAA